MHQDEYDIVIIGSGMGGLACGYILAKEGFNVCILEKNQQFGGGLQTFKLDNTIFDTGVHYVGGLDEGQSLHQYFKYFDIMDKLKVKRLDSDGFEQISFDQEEKVFKYGLGRDNFVEILAQDFPKERNNLKSYVDKMYDIGSNYPFYNLRDKSYNQTMDFRFMDQSIYDFIDNHFNDELLKKVIGGNNLLYAGNKNTSTLYEHALITNAYIESSYRFVDGAGQVATKMVRNLRKLGATVKRYQNVQKIYVENNEAKCVELQNGRKIYAKKVISNLHPVNTMKMLEGANVKKAFLNRLNAIPNSSSAFSLHLVLKENTVPYQNFNTYHFRNDNIWNGIDYKQSEWPDGYMAFTPISSKSDKWADSMIVLAGMLFDEVEQWQNTENVVGFEMDRGESYENFKEEKSQKLLEVLYKRFPEVKGNVLNYNASTPLTYRDYLYSPGGSIYGYLKDFNQPLLSYLSPKTKVSNLFFTGQNVNMHGVLGVTVTAFMTCGEILGKEYLYNKVKIN